MIQGGFAYIETMKILYFAWLRARIGLAEETLVPPDGIKDVAALADYLASQSAGHAAAFADREVVRIAVNQDYVDWTHLIAAGDEIAFFPPVTGG